MFCFAIQTVHLTCLYCLVLCLAGSIKVADFDARAASIQPGCWHVVAIVVRLGKPADASVTVHIDGVALPLFKHTELCDLAEVRADLRLCFDFSL
jgi:hypothetical protein